MSPQTPTTWKVARGWRESFRCEIPAAFPQQPWVLYSRVEEHVLIYISKAEATSPPEAQWHSIDLRSKIVHPVGISVTVTGEDTVRIIEYVNDDFPEITGEISEVKLGEPEPTIPEDWVLSRGWHASFECEHPASFPINPWVLYSKDKQSVMYINKHDTLEVPADKWQLWHSLNIQTGGVQPEPQIAITVTGEDTVIVTDNREAQPPAAHTNQLQIEGSQHLEKEGGVQALVTVGAGNWRKTKSATLKVKKRRRKQKKRMENFMQKFQRINNLIGGRMGRRGGMRLRRKLNLNRGGTRGQDQSDYETVML